MDRRSDKKRPSDRRSIRKDGDGAFGRGEGRRQRPARMSIPKGTEINYKNIAFLQKCLTERGKLLSRRLTSANASQQRQIGVAVKLARFLGLLPVGSSRRK
ncbi:MAG: 30S ribosomal protein S18 [Candidatus Omnitrophica bacterium]|nr:30S ribosomal protein S18 [Candidatus Omnitrophota bacterium]